MALKRWNSRIYNIVDLTESVVGATLGFRGCADFILMTLCELGVPQGVLVPFAA
ncbi:MAG TPA: hypothetical protein VNU93_07115 [Verrucomicrobiae bacterium]|nr:hypothetical protein [Verrucomicrobiae bacterium]